MGPMKTASFKKGSIVSHGRSHAASCGPSCTRTQWKSRRTQLSQGVNDRCSRDNQTKKQSIDWRHHGLILDPGLSPLRDAVQKAEEQNDVTAAQNILVRMLHMRPGDAWAHNKLGCLLYNWRGSLGEARHHLELAVAAAPAWGLPRYHLALTLMDCGFLAEAEAMVRAAIRDAPGLWPAHKLLGQVLVKLGRTTEAQQAFTAAIEARQLRADGAQDAKLPRWPAGKLGKPAKLQLVNDLMHACNRGRQLILETLSVAPLVFRIPQLLTEAECEHIIGLARKVGTGESQIAAGSSSSRLSENTFVKLQSASVLAPFAERAACALGLKMSTLLAHAEQMQIVHYRVGGYYDVHMDATDFQPRHATLLCYLEAPESGGETVFPLASNESTSNVSFAQFQEAKEYVKHGTWVVEPRGLQVAPRLGDAVLWYNLSETAGPDLRSCHAALAVREGEKWVANLWVAVELPA